MSRRREGTAGVRVRPTSAPVLAHCWWEGCENLTDNVAVVELLPPGSRVIRQPREVVICLEHEKVALRTGRIRLRFHPDDLPAMRGEQAIEF